MPRLAILGSYPEGLPGITHEEKTNGKWDAWRRGANQPAWIWQAAEAELRTAIGEYGYVNIYVYYGQERDRNIEYALRMDDLRLSPRPIASPGPALGAGTTCRIWLKYTDSGSLAPLNPKVPRERFLQLILKNGRFEEKPQPIDARAWEQMYLTGLIFVADPCPGVLRSPRKVVGR